MSIKNIFVCGSGFMGSGIAQVSAVSGYNVTLYDVKEEMVEKAKSTIKWSLEKFISKGKITDDLDSILNRLNYTLVLNEAKDADLVIEAAPEVLSVKKEIFEKLDSICKKETILATNTSSLPITNIASVTNRIEKVIGLHFFSPVPLMKLVEIVKGFSTNERTVSIVKNYCVSVGKEPIVAQKDVAGFIVNRTYIVCLLEAIKLYEEGVGTPEEIDKGMKLGYNWPMGPFEILDMTGVDVNYSMLKGMFEETGDPRFDPPRLIKRLYSCGFYGRKSGKGVYEY